MASREELSIIRAARGGQSEAQIALGKKYLYGGTGLPKSIPTALYWLDRAARQDVAEAWSLIGRHVPSDVVLRAGLAASVLPWYERAYDAGCPEAGVELGRLVLSLPPQAVAPALRRKALAALDQAGQGEAGTARPAPMVAAATRKAMGSGAATDAGDASGNARAAGDLAWMQRCAQALHRSGAADPSEVEARLERNAMAGDGQARLSLGLWLARIDRAGVRMPAVPGAAQYKRAIRWLLLAAGQGVADAAYALSKIYLKPEFSQRSVQDARLHLERAALAGHAQAQHEMGISAWRQRHRDPAADIRAAYWLQQAAAKGVTEAATLLAKVAPPPVPASWALSLLAGLQPGAGEAHPALVARVELASIFGLSRAEALLIDLRSADRDHCLLVDIRAGHGHSRRRLIGVPSLAQRHALLHIVARLEECGEVRGGFEIARDRGGLAVDGEPQLSGARSSYRQRLYRLKRLQAAR